MSLSNTPPVSPSYREFRERPPSERGGYREARDRPPSEHGGYRESRDRPPSERGYRGDEPRRFPRNEREFGNSIREERAALGGAGEFPDAYRLNDYRRDDNYGDMFRGAPSGPSRMNDIDRGLGYLP